MLLEGHHGGHVWHAVVGVEAGHGDGSREGHVGGWEGRGEVGLGSHGREVVGEGNVWHDDWVVTWFFRFISFAVFVSVVFVSFSLAHMEGDVGVFGVSIEVLDLLVLLVA